MARQSRREWGTGSCYQVNGHWRVAISLGADPFGKRRRKEWQFSSQARAEAKLREVQRRLDRGEHFEESRMTLGAYIPEWLSAVEHSVRPATFAQYRSLAEVHLDELAPFRLARLGPADIRALLASRLKDGYATRTVRGILDVLRMMLRQALEDGHVERNVAALVKPPRLEQRTPQHFSAEQARRFLDVTKDDELGSLYAVALGTGLRRGELLGLVWRDCDLARGTIRVRASKTAAGIRTVPIPPFGRDALARLERSPGPIWPVSPSWVTHHFADLCRKAGVPVLTFHSTRHTAASLMLDAGVDPFTIQAVLGHSKPTMTGFYSRAGDELRRDAVERLGRAIG